MAESRGFEIYQQTGLTPAPASRTVEPRGFEIYQQTGLTPAPASRTVEPRGFEIYQQTGLTPAPASRTAAVNKQHCVQQIHNDKENQFMIASAAATAAVRSHAEDELMAVDYVSICLISLCCCAS